ncbi:gamma-glutamyltransferase family protein [Corynebacterium sp. CCM 9185]|uniref:Gamma-glutamyltransferase family protein n=1 Tax=Corynebacterium marambiense TaxID=2765364 RepID=A0ABS0VSM9_9CORY|nr:gamma-glutamyltransferase family protein [Corynebacterium marambiense]MBI8999769.1 gamma-glutamyltransferase family protein [Corynebacterium marambiense]MCK7662609.1 gamma-glutamyltransferase family protein [Corynebacterium marambiense]
MTPPSSDPAPGGRDTTTSPEISTGYREDMVEVLTDFYAVSTANRYATDVAAGILADGGSALDAAVAAQFMLGLTEPQSSGIGGGCYLLHFDAASGETTAFDGRETAPAAATGTYLTRISADDPRPPVPDALRSGRSVGVPGAVVALELAHRKFGRTDWSELIAPAIRRAGEGFPVSHRLWASIDDAKTDLARCPEAARYFLDDVGEAKAEGTVLTNPDYARTCGLIAERGADALHTGELAEAIVERVCRPSETVTPGLMTLADLAGYRAVECAPLWSTYRGLRLAGMPPSSSGGVTVAAILGMLEYHDLGEPPRDGAPAAELVHLVSEAERLAYADRDTFIADGYPLPEMLDHDYLRKRAALIDPDRTMGTAEPGLPTNGLAAGRDLPEYGTSQVSVIDAEGNAVSLTTSIEIGFGSFHMVRGFLLNNTLTDFSAEPADSHGRPVANRVEPGKRPRSSMAPTLVFDGPDLRAVVGAPGGAVIIQYVVKILIALIDWGFDSQQAVGAPNFGARNTQVTGVGGEHPLIGAAEGGLARALIDGLVARGHRVQLADQPSGAAVLVVRPDGRISGGADPRREGTVGGV